MALNNISDQDVVRPQILGALEAFGGVGVAEREVSDDQRRRALVELLIRHSADNSLAHDASYLAELAKVNSAPEGALINILLRGESTAHLVTQVPDGTVTVDETVHSEEATHWLKGTSLWPLDTGQLYLSVSNETGFLMNGLNPYFLNATDLMQWIRYFKAGALPALGNLPLISAAIETATAIQVPLSPVEL